MYITTQTSDLLEDLVNLELTPDQEDKFNRIVSELQKSAFRHGYIEGVCATSYEEDGERVVGLNKKPLLWWAENLKEKTAPFMAQFDTVGE